ncbi:acyl-CoA thioesterase [Halomonas korlensis]|uniref:4-hydroxybenzoyl-CoA thioesterase n=1 Tax=Halomonas korlensis TaxID=463301 RepID=A0A1I7J9T6_9GAMM|nr:thioesterase family protein [Halomonas korlensis]SFU81970.1 4-hydroxybenzoyl-CoA thioesterase [Halomonas korlensis]
MKTIPMQTPFYYRRPIRWGDTDVAGIVFTGHYFDICMEAIESWFIEVLELDWFILTQDHGIGTPFVHAEVDFHAPLTPRDGLSVRVDVERMGNSSLSLALTGKRNSDDQHSFTGSFICCFSDIRTMTNIPIPEWMRRRIDHYQQSCAA